MCKTAEQAVCRDGFAQNNGNIACNSLSFIELTETKSYITVPACLLDALFKLNLPDIAKLYYVLADCLAKLALAKGNHRKVQKSGPEWAYLLGKSEDYLYTIQEKLEKQGLFSIKRSFSNNQKNMNVITPILPESLFNQVSTCKNQTQYEFEQPASLLSPLERRKSLDKTKLFIKLNLKLLFSLLQESRLTSFEKVLWLHCYQRSYITYQDNLGEGTRKFITSNADLMECFNHTVSKSTLSRAMQKLEKFGFLSRQQIYMRSADSAFNRRSKSTWEVEALFPNDRMVEILQQPNRSNLAEEVVKDFTLAKAKRTKNTAAVNKETSVAKRSDQIAKRSRAIAPTPEFNNKNINNKTIINKNLKLACSKPTLEKKVMEIALPSEVILKKNTEQRKLQCIVEDFKKQTNRYLQLGFTEFKAKQASAEKLPSEEKQQLLTIAQGLYQNYQEIKQTKGGQEAKRYLSALCEVEQALLLEFMLPKSHRTLLQMEPPCKKLNQNLLLLPQKKAIPELPAVTHPDLMLPFNYQMFLDEKLQQLRKNNQLTGFAAKVPLEELKEQLIYYALHFKPQKVGQEPVKNAINVACYLVKTGKWQAPYGLAKHREQLWTAEKIQNGEIRQGG